MTNFNNDTCSVCLEDFDTTSQNTSLKCGHTFHVGCIINCLRKSNECPNCRDTDGNPKISVSNSNNNAFGFFFDEDDNNSTDSAFDQTLTEYKDFFNTMKTIEKENIDLKQSIHNIISEGKKLEKKSQLISKNYDKELNNVTIEFLKNYKLSNEYTEYFSNVQSYKKQYSKLIQKIKKQISKKLDFEIDPVTMDFIIDYLDEKRIYSEYCYFKLPQRIYF
jgi:hypothetical protein